MRTALIALCSSLVLAACGGGGDDGAGANGGASQSAPAQVAITNKNYVDAAQLGLTSSTYLLDASSLALGSQVSNENALMQFGLQQMKNAPQLFAAVKPTAVGAVQTESFSCQDGGGLTASANDANDNGIFDNGDSLSITANQCKQNGMLINGGLVVNLTSLAGEPGTFPYSLSGTLALQNLTVTSADGAVSAGSGSISVSLSAPSSSQQHVGISVSSFAVTRTYLGATDTLGLSNYKATLDETSATVTTSAEGTIISSIFGSQSVQIKTTVPFVRAVTDAYPSSGSVTVIGAANSEARATAENNQTVLLELDADGDGVFEANTVKAWADIAP